MNATGKDEGLAARGGVSRFEILSINSQVLAFYAIRP